MLPKHLMAGVAVLALAGITPAAAQSRASDVVVMRRVLTAPAPLTNPSGFAWQTGEWGPPDSTCSEQAVEARDVRCVRDGAVQDASLCRGEPPAGTRTVRSVDGCSFAWRTAAWSEFSSACSVAATRTRAVACYRTDGRPADRDGDCAAPAPAASETADVSSGCTWEAVSWDEATFDDACSSATVRRETASCRRSDGTPAAADACTSRGIALTRATPAANYAGCTYAWSYSDWGAPSSSCSDAATQDRSAACRRSNGDAVADAYCTGPKRSTTRTVSALDGCTFDWRVGGWSDYSSSCSSAAVRSRTAACYRSDGQRTDAADRCPAPAPAANETADVQTGCTWSAVDWGGATYDSACSSSTVKQETASCQRSDGTAASASACTSRGVALTRATTSTNYAGCSYDWVYSAWGPSSSRCSDTATQTRTATCRRSNGDDVADASCPGVKKATTRTVSDRTGCPVQRTCNVQSYRRLTGDVIYLGRYSTRAQVNAACGAISGVTACGFYNSDGLQTYYTTAPSPQSISTGIDYSASTCS